MLHRTSKACGSRGTGMPYPDHATSSNNQGAYSVPSAYGPPSQSYSTNHPPYPYAHTYQSYGYASGHPSTYPPNDPYPSHPPYQHSSVSVPGTFNNPLGPPYAQNNSYIPNSHVYPPPQSSAHHTYPYNPTYPPSQQWQQQQPYPNTSATTTNSTLHSPYSHHQAAPISPPGGTNYQSARIYPEGARSPYASSASNTTNIASSSSNTPSSTYQPPVRRGNEYEAPEISEGGMRRSGRTRDSSTAEYEYVYETDEKEGSRRR